MRVTVVGSSVAFGFRASQSWVLRLTKAVEPFGVTVVNCAECGANTAKTLERFDDILTQTSPDVVIISLSLNNEGLLRKGNSSVDACETFESNLRELVRRAEVAGARVLLGSVYPNGRYNHEHHAKLVESNAKLAFEAVPWRIAAM